MTKYYQHPKPLHTCTLSFPISLVKQNIDKIQKCEVTFVADCSKGRNHFFGDCTKIGIKKEQLRCM